MTNDELNWIAGWLEGEGTFYIGKNGTAAIIQAFSTDRDVIEYAVKLCGAKKVHYIKPRKHPNGWMSSEGWRLHLESEDAISLMKQIHPLMCQRRKEKISEVLSAWENRPNRPIEKLCACGCGRKTF